MRYTLRRKHSRERFLDRLETGNHVYKARRCFDVWNVYNLVTRARRIKKKKGFRGHVHIYVLCMVRLAKVFEPLVDIFLFENYNTVAITIVKNIYKLQDI